MIKFEIVKDYENKDINLPKRGTKGSAGYDIESATRIVVPSILQKVKTIRYGIALNMEKAKQFIKNDNLRVMVPTGVKVQMPEDVVLKIHPRSSTGCNYILHLANQTGIIDSDYYNNKDNEGHIYIPLINLSPYDIIIEKGEKIAQGIFMNYLITDDDEADKERTGGFGSTDIENDK